MPWSTVFSNPEKHNYGLRSSLINLPWVLEPQNLNERKYDKLCSSVLRKVKNSIRNLLVIKFGPNNTTKFRGNFLANEIECIVIDIGRNEKHNIVSMISVICNIFHGHR